MKAWVSHHGTVGYQLRVLEGEVTDCFYFQFLQEVSDFIAREFPGQSISWDITSSAPPVCGN